MFELAQFSQARCTGPPTSSDHDDLTAKTRRQQLTAATRRKRQTYQPPLVGTRIRLPRRCL
jgi:hypothetical protein